MIETQQILFRSSQIKFSLFSLSIIFTAACSNNKPSHQAHLNDFIADSIDGSSLPAKTVSLTFDDGPGPRSVELGRFLAAEGIQATFFVVGENVVRFKQETAELAKLGHLIANHSYSHTAMTKADDPIAEIQDTDKLISQYIPKNTYLFRPPYADWGARLPVILNKTLLKKYVGPVLWDVGGHTTKRYSADWDCWAYNDSLELCAQGYMNEFRDKDHGIALFHDIHSKTIDMVKLHIVPALKKEGFKFVRLDAVPDIKEALAFAQKELEPEKN